MQAHFCRFFSPNLSNCAFSEFCALKPVILLDLITRGSPYVFTLNALIFDVQMLQFTMSQSGDENKRVCCVSIDISNVFLKDKPRAVSPWRLDIESELSHVPSQDPKPPGSPLIDGSVSPKSPEYEPNTPDDDERPYAPRSPPWSPCSPPSTDAPPEEKARGSTCVRVFCVRVFEFLFVAGSFALQRAVYYQVSEGHALEFTDSLV